MREAANRFFPVNVIPQKIYKPRVDIYFPVFVSIPSPIGQQKINTVTYGLVNRLLEEQGYYQSPAATSTGWFELKTNQRWVLSYYLGNYTFTGGAHGLTIIKALTFTINDGRQYSLAELFKPGSDYVEVLSAIVARQIKDRGIQTLDGFKTIRPDQDFYIADKSLVLYFQLYEITPYAFGFPFFPIPIYDIEGIINMDGPLGRMFGDF